MAPGNHKRILLNEIKYESLQVEKSSNNTKGAGDSYVSMLGHERLLCPSSLQTPQRLRLQGGSTFSSPLVGATRAGVPGALVVVRGTPGNGQVMSLSLSGQNSRMWS